MKTKRIVRSVTAVILSLILTLSVASIGVSAADTVTITFNATVANSIPQGTKISIGSTLNGWNPKDTSWFAAQLDETHFRLTVSVSSKYIGQEIEYKWTLQHPDNTDGNGWEYPENSSGTEGFGNRKFTVQASNNVLNDTVTFPDKAIKINETLTRGTLDTIEMEMPQFSDGRTRTIRVWLPDGYDPNDAEKKYSVLYMHDGQNLFDASTSFLGEWEVDESLSKLMDEGYESTIVVGIDNGEDKRFNELSPSWELSTLGKNYISAPVGEKYADFIVNTVKSYIDRHYNTKPQREYTGIGGSSMGGIMSMYMAMEYSDVFDYGIVLSPAMHVYNDDVLDKFFDSYNFNTMKHLPKIYLFAGAKTAGSEPGSAYDEACITKYVDIIKNDLTDRGYPGQIIGTLIDENECHLESAWAKILPKALQWLKSVTEPERTEPATESTTAPTTQTTTEPTTEPATAIPATEPATEPPTTVPIGSNECGVTATSNLSNAASQIFDLDTTGKITVTYKLKSSQPLRGAQWQLTYDKTKLTLSSSNYDENGGLKIMPVADSIGDSVADKSENGTIKGNFQGDKNAYDFTNDNVLVSVDFDILAAGTAEVNLDVQYVTYIEDTNNVVTMIDNSEKTDSYNAQLTAFISSSSGENPTEPPVRKLMGDVDGDGELTVKDAAAIQLYKARLLAKDAVFDESVADYDCDGEITVKDAARIQLVKAGLAN